MADTVDSRRVREFSESPEEFEKKLDQLTEMVRTSKNTVFFTGAGISTAAGIADYRGPTGKWTQQRVKKLATKGSLTQAEKSELGLLLSEARKKKGGAGGGIVTSANPTLGHMVLSTLVRHGLAKHVVTTNLDGLHRKSGLIHHKSLTCLHGDIYIERCTACGHEEERDYHVRQKARRKLDVHDHSIGTCNKCGSKPPKSYTGHKGPGGERSGLVCPRDKNCGTKDTHINFGESLDEIDWDEAERACGEADLCIVVGTSMSLRHVTHMPFMSKRTVIINLQKTPDDDDAHLRIFAHCDPVLSGVMQRLGLEVDPAPVWHRTSGSPKLPSVAPKKGATSRAMRQHICSSTASGNSSLLKEREVVVQPAAFGVKVTGRRVSRVTAGSQAEALGVQVGWQLTRIAGVEMPSSGQAAADAITRALAESKKLGKPYKICFQILDPLPRTPTPPGSRRNLTSNLTTKTTTTTKRPGTGKKQVDTKSAFRSFSSGLGGGSGLDHMAVLQAHQTMLNITAQMGALETAEAC